ncbi:MAG: Rieske (2Fe-2S) protein [Chloroflexota bacterium]
MAKYVVATVDEIAPGEKKIVDVAGRSIGVYNIKGEYFAILNRCPHQAGPLCLGLNHGFLRPAGVGEFQYSRPGEIVRCPWHGWEYDIKTGQSWIDPRTVRVRTYEVTVQGGANLQPGDMLPENAPHGEPATDPEMAGMVKGPYVAETFPVTVEQQYVVVEVGGRPASS